MLSVTKRGFNVHDD